jgi:hypothetical protein
MSDQMDSTQSAGSTQGLPDPAGSSVTGDQPHSDGTTSSLVSSVLELIRSDPDVRTEIGRILRSDKDRGVHKAVTQSTEALEATSSIKEELARIAPYLKNVSPEDLATAQRMAEDEEMRTYYKEWRASRKSSVGTEPNVSKVVKDIGTAFNVDWNDPGIKEILATTAEDELVGKFAVYASERKLNKPPASPAGIGAPVGGSPPTGEFSGKTDDELGSRLGYLAMNEASTSKPERDRINAELKRRASNR